MKKHKPGVRADILKTLCFAGMMFLVSYLPALCANPQQQQKKERVSHKQILERVDVTNVKVIVRVFHNDLDTNKSLKPMKGLKKEDFKIITNGKEIPINGFYERHRILTNVFDSKIDPAVMPTQPQDGTKGRLFFLIFNIMDYQEELGQLLDIFFSEVFRKGDWLMVISNSFFFDARRINRPAREKMKLKQMLNLESRTIHAKIKQLTQRLADMRRLFLQQLSTPTASHRHVRDNLQDEFVNNYVALLSEYKRLTLKIDAREYTRLAEFLDDQPLHKWVLSFYQSGRFFKPKLNSGFMKKMMGNLQQNLSPKRTERYYQLINALEPKKNLPREDLAKLFINTGAGFHTLLLKNRGVTNNELAADLSIEKFLAEPYYLLKTISKETGGMFLPANKTNNFFKTIAQQEDTFYELTYVPTKKKKQKIKILLNGKRGNNYRISYDNQDRSKYMRKLINKKHKTIPHIRVEKVFINQQELSIVVSNFLLTTGNPNEKSIKIPLRLQVLNRDSKSSFDGLQVFEINKNQLKSAKLKLKIGLPALPKGSYQFLIWVNDPLTGKKDLAVEEIDVPGN